MESRPPVANHRATRRTSIALSTVLAAALGLSLGPATVSSALPAKRSDRIAIEQARRELAGLEHRLDLAVEDFDQSKIALAVAKRKAAGAEARVTRAQAKLNRLQAAMGLLAAAAYRSGGSDPLVALVNSSSPENYLDSASSLDQIARGQADQLVQLRAARHDLRDTQTAARQTLVAQSAIERRMAEIKTGIERDVTRQAQLLDVLETREARRVRLAAEARARERARRLAAERASRSRRISVYSGSASGRAAIAVREAYAQLGTPYSWGADGPGSFDCSGLMMWVWGKAGVSLPHSSRAQYGVGFHVSQSELRPGDLVFYGSPIHHVGIYVGGGQYIHAPHSGDVVKISDAFRGDYTGAVRI